MSAARSRSLASLLRPIALITFFATLPAAPPCRAQTVDTTLWQPDNTVTGLLVAGGRLYVRGNFTSFRGVPRHLVASLDLATGRVTSWDPNPDGTVYGLAAKGDTVYVGGSFTQIGGVMTSPFLAAVDSSAGHLTGGWFLGAAYTVTALAVSGDVVYTHVSGGPGGYGSVVATEGTRTRWAVSTYGGVDGLCVAGGRVYVYGSLWIIGGQACSNIAALDALSGAVLSWNPKPNNVVRAVAVDGTKVFLGGAFNQVGQSLTVMRNKIACIDASSANATAWNPGAGGTVTALAVANGVVYLAGGFAAVDGATRHYLAALNESDGTATAWAPEPTSLVSAIALDGSTVYVGGNFSVICGQTDYYLARMEDSITPTLLALFEAEAVEGGVLLRWGFHAPAMAVTVERAPSAAGPWSAVPAEIAERVGATEALDRTAAAGQDYWYRLVATMAGGVQSVFGPIEARLPGGAAISGITRVTPNPASGPVAVEYAVARAQPVRLSVVDVAGRELAVLVDGEAAPGRHTARWDGRGARGPLAAGVYFARLRAGARTSESRFVLLR